MELEEIELGDNVRKIIETSRRHWELREAILDANTTATPVEERGLAADSAISVR